MIIVDLVTEVIIEAVRILLPGSCGGIGVSDVLYWALFNIFNMLLGLPLFSATVVLYRKSFKLYVILKTLISVIELVNY